MYICTYISIYLSIYLSICLFLWTIYATNLIPIVPSSGCLFMYRTWHLSKQMSNKYIVLYLLQQFNRYLILTSFWFHFSMRKRMGVKRTSASVREREIHNVTWHKQTWCGQLSWSGGGTWRSSTGPHGSFLRDDDKDKKLPLYNKAGNASNLKSNLFNSNI